MEKFNIIYAFAIPHASAENPIILFSPSLINAHAIPWDSSLLGAPIFFPLVPQGFHLIQADGCCQFA